MKTINSIFTALVLLSLALPPLGHLGARGFAKVHGFDSPAPRPSASARAIFSGACQREFAAWHEQQMFGRNELLQLKNGIYELANFGRYHSGYAGRVIQGADGVLFESSYIRTRLAPPQKCRSPEYAARFAQAADALRQALAERGVAFGVALAPSKADVCRGQIPARHLRFAPAHDGFDLHASLSAALAERGVPHANGNAVCEPYIDTDIAFPYSGTHWTVWAAALTATNLISRINEHADSAFPMPLPQNMRHEKTPFTDTDRDIADLLNLPWDYRQKGAAERYVHFDFGETQTNNIAGAMLLGDSFCNQFRKALLLSGAYPRKRLQMYSNRLPTQKKLAALAAGSDVFFAVYTSGALASDRARKEMEHVARLLRGAAPSADGNE
jgi:hypothetical protein